MNRRDFVHTTLLATATATFAGFKTTGNDESFIITVNGKINADKLGFTLIHEHVMVDFIGADKVNADRYKKEEVINKVKPFLDEIVKSGANSFIDCTPAYLGRDVEILQNLSKATGVNIITNTGYYGASKEKFVPAFAYTETAEQIAARWINEFENGIDDTNIKPGFIKSGVDGFPLSAVQKKLIESAAITHLSTGLTIAIHTGDGKAALEEMKIIKSKKVHPSAWIWVHAQNEKDNKVHLGVAKEGGWISFDGLGDENVEEYVQFLQLMKKEKLLNKVLISHDAGWYNVGDKDGGNFRPYTALFNKLLPRLKEEGFSAADIQQVFIKNPAAAFAVNIKPLI